MAKSKEERSAVAVDVAFDAEAMLPVEALHRDVVNPPLPLLPATPVEFRL